MRILQLCNKVPFPSKDGGSIAIANLTKGLAKLGNKVDVLAMNTKKHFVEPNDHLNPDKTNIELHYILVDTGINPVHLVINFLFSKYPYNAQRFISKTYRDLLRKLLTNNHYDVVQLEGLYLYPYISQIRKYTQAKIAYRAHNMEHEIWHRLTENSKKIKRIYLRNLERRILNLEKKMLQESDIVLPISHADARKLYRLNPHHSVKIIPSGIDPVKYKSNPVRSKDIFFIGSLDWLPNREGLSWFLQNVWPSFSKELPQIKFHIAGRNAPGNFLKRTDYQNIFFHGEVESSTEFMQKYGIMIVPLFAGSGMRVKIIEAMALGKPIVSTATGAEGIDVTHGENILIANNDKEFKSELNTLLTDEHIFRNMEKNSVQFVHKFYNNVNICTSLHQFYKKQV